jgi:hypothetical protein
VKRRLKVLVSLLLVAGVVAAAPAGAERPEDPGAAAEAHRRVVEFWTPDRVAQAVPLDMTRGFDGVRRPTAPGGNGGGKPDKPDKPGGGGGGEEPPPDTGGIEVVDGDSWVAEGAVADLTGKVLFAFGDSYYICSAGVVSDGNTGDARALVLTAAHCVFDTAKDTPASKWMFVPNYDAIPEQLDRNGTFCSQTEHGCWAAEEIFLSADYVAATSFNDAQDRAIDNDFAIASVLPGGKDFKTTGTELDSYLVGLPSVGAIPTLDTSGLGVDKQVWDFGYPAEKKYKGGDLIYCAGGTAWDPRAPEGMTYQLAPCGLNGGSSGGMWFGPGSNLLTGIATIVSVNSYGYPDLKAIHGPVFDSDTAAVMSAADGGGAGNGVSSFSPSTW